MLTKSPNRPTLPALLLLACAAALPATARAQPAATPASANASDEAMNQAVSQRITALQTRLAITPAEQADWNAFAQAMRDNAASTNTLFKQRADAAASMSALDNMKSYAAIARAYADNTQRLADAFGVLYAKLSPEQQKAADVLFRQPPPPASK